VEGGKEEGRRGMTIERTNNRDRDGINEKRGKKIIGKGKLK
jgi:hypothetical protein